jgi:hypothetical protein
MWVPVFMNNNQNEDGLQSCLEALVVDNPDLDRLKQLANQFNIFEVVDRQHPRSGLEP